VTRYVGSTVSFYLRFYLNKEVKSVQAYKKAQIFWVSPVKKLKRRTILRESSFVTYNATHVLISIV